MPTRVAQRIDFLMKLTNTPNTVLGRALRFDASYISRIRSGKRGLPPEQPFIVPAAAYFAAHLKEDYQKNAAAEMLRLPGPWPENEEEARALLTAWLENGPAEGSPVERMIAAMTGPERRPSLAETDYPAQPGSPAEALLFYGNSGKRSAVLRFLTALCQTGRPHTLCLFSDEDMTWLVEDDGFVRAWAALLVRLAETGSRVRIIHSVGRDSGELWEAVQKWLPLYMSGAIEPYYYPRVRDGVYRRTLFVASGHSAVIADGVKGQKGPTVNLLLRDAAAVQALEQEFNAYLALCRPLMETAFPESKAELARLVRAFQAAPGPLLAALSGSALVCHRAGAGALVVKTEPPYAAFSLQEPRITAAIQDYLGALPGGDDPALAARRLADFLKGLEAR